MSGMIASTAESAARDWSTLLFTGLGITFLPHEYLGGLFLALAGASIARHFDKETDRRELWAVMLVAFFVSHLAALAAQVWAPTWPPQGVMAAAGFASRFATRTALRVLGLVEKRSDRIADRIVDRVLPPGQGGQAPPPKEEEPLP
jgi:hypothetical protein